MIRGAYRPKYDTNTGNSGSKLYSWIGSLKPGESISFRIYPPKNQETEVPFQHKEHFIPTNLKGKKINRTVMCTADSEETGGKCYICDEKAKGGLNADWGNKDPMRRMGAVIEDLTVYHEVKTGTGDDEKTQYIACTGRRCKYCEEGVPTITGGKRVLSLAPTHFKPVTDAITTDLFGVCRDCGEYMDIESVVCSECGNVLLTQAALNTMSDEDFTKYLITKQTCSSCGKQEYPEVQFKCKHCGSTQELLLEDIVWTMKRVGSTKDNSVYNVSYVIDPVEKPFDPVCYTKYFTTNEQAQKKILEG